MIETIKLLCNMLAYHNVYTAIIDETVFEATAKIDTGYQNISLLETLDTVPILQEWLGAETNMSLVDWEPTNVNGHREMRIQHFDQRYVLHLYDKSVITDSINDIICGDYFDFMSPDLALKRIIFRAMKYGSNQDLVAIINILEGMGQQINIDPDILKGLLDLRTFTLPRDIKNKAYVLAEYMTLSQGNYDEMITWLSTRLQ